MLCLVEVRSAQGLVESPQSMSSLLVIKHVTMGRFFFVVFFKENIKF